MKLLVWRRHWSAFNWCIRSEKLRYELWSPIASSEKLDVRSRESQAAESAALTNEATSEFRFSVK